MSTYPQLRRSSRMQLLSGSSDAMRVIPPPAPGPTARFAAYHFDLCAATAVYFIFAQHNILLSLRHDTLVVDRCFDKHAEQILLLEVDNVSEQGQGCWFVSYDSGQTAIVWDLSTGIEKARFAVYDPISRMTWMRDGRIAFGNTRGHLVIFDPATSEHVSSRTIGDPITALAIAADSKMFAIGYENGSIFIARPFPTFEVQHVLHSSRNPLPIIGLAWHGSSSRQESEMLAAQSQGGDLKVWSIKKDSAETPPRIIRQLHGAENPEQTKAWFAWSKSGRLVQHFEDETKIWDVRTKKVTYIAVPTVDDVVAITNYGPEGKLFTMSQPHIVQQYDVDPDRVAMLVKSAQHVPTNAPPTPPDSVEEKKTNRGNYTVALEGRPPIHLDVESSEDDAPYSAHSFQEFARDLDEERRDRVGPLSPGSSRASLSSASSYGNVHRRRQPSREKTTPSRSSNRSGASDGTVFSDNSSSHGGYDSSSARSSPMPTPSRYPSSSLRHVMLRNHEESKQMKSMDLFHHLKARLNEVPFRSPRYVSTTTTSDVLRQEMLRVVFGWDADVESLIRDEQSRHRQGSPSSVLLSKWLGDLGVDHVAQLLSTESMTSSDWMLLALSCQMGQGSQKQVGEAFVRRMLETGDIHSAVAVLLGLGEQVNAIDVYANHEYFMEAALLSCLTTPSDWPRQSFLIRKWGEMAVSQGQPNLAVRCFSCTSLGSNDPSQSTGNYTLSQSNTHASRTDTQGISTRSPLSADNIPQRITTKTASLKLITSFKDNGKPALPPKDIGVTPIIESALSPNSDRQWYHQSGYTSREPSSARTLTPGRTRQPSSEATPRDRRERLLLRVDLPPARREKTPEAVGGKRADSAPAAHRFNVTMHTLQPSVFSGASNKPQHQNDRAATKASLVAGSTPATAIVTETPQSKSLTTRSSHQRSQSSMPTVTPTTPHSKREVDEVTLFEMGTANVQYGNLDRQLAAARLAQRQDVSGSSYPDNANLENEDAADSSQSRGRPLSRLVEPELNSPSTPSSNSGQLKSTRMAQDVRSPILTMVTEQGSPFATTRRSNRQASRSHSPAVLQSPSKNGGLDRECTADSDGHVEPAVHQGPPPTYRPDRLKMTPFRNNTAAAGSLAGHRFTLDDSHNDIPEEATVGRSENTMSNNRIRMLTKKEIAARELEERRLSLARRPSAPTIPHPHELSATRPRYLARAMTDDGLGPGPSTTSSSTSSLRSDYAQASDPRTPPRQSPMTRGASSPVPRVGLPAAPGVFRYPKQMNTDATLRPRTAALPESPNDRRLGPYIQKPGGGQHDDVPSLLPSTVYVPGMVLPRSVSAPLEKAMTEVRRTGSTREVNDDHSRATRNISEILHTPSVELDNDEKTAQDASHVTVLETTYLTDAPPLLPALQHLAGIPPPPPPLPVVMQEPESARSSMAGSISNSGIISIALESSPTIQSVLARTATPMTPLQEPSSSHASPSRSPSAQRRRSLVASGADTIQNKWRNVAERMSIRSPSNSRAATRTKSPPLGSAVVDSHTESPYATSPYETVLPGMPAKTGDVTWSPPGPPAPIKDGPWVGTTEMPRSHSRSGSISGASIYRSPKQIRANVPPEELQAGVYRPE